MPWEPSLLPHALSLNSTLLESDQEKMVLDTELIGDHFDKVDEATFEDIRAFIISEHLGIETKIFCQKGLRSWTAKASAGTYQLPSPIAPDTESCRSPATASGKHEVQIVQLPVIQPLSKIQPIFNAIRPK